MLKLLNLYLCLISYILLTFNSYGQSFIQTTSPCPHIFQYNPSGYGDIRVPSPKFGDKLLIQVEHVLFGSRTSEDVGSLNLFRSQDETLQMIISGARYIQFVLRFPRVLTNFLPQIIRISYNGNVICSGTTDNAIPGERFFIKLHYTYYSGRTFGNNIQSPINFPIEEFDNFENNFDRYQTGQIADPPFSRPQISTNNIVNNKNNPNPTYPGPHIVNNNNNNNNLNQTDPGTQGNSPQYEPAQPQQLQQNYTRDKAICGEIDPRFLIGTLIYGGKNIRHGSWPWLTAIFISKDLSLEYQCSGNLVSNRVVVSAAHCFIIEGRQILASKVYVHLGRHNLDLWEEEGHAMSSALKIKIHEEYKISEDYLSADADIAVVVLKRIVEYNLFIRPLCLWSGSTELEQIVGSTATVVGWGLTETGMIASEAKSINIPIVSNVVCLKQSNDRFRYITSERTFCAGTREGTGPCNGDSGSGLAIQQSNKKWELRGIVSTSAADKATRTNCDLSQFVVFTDVAKFTDFIREYIDLSYTIS